MKTIIGWSLGEAALSYGFADTAATSGVALFVCKIETAPGPAWAGSCTPGTAGDFLPLVTLQRCS